MGTHRYVVVKGRFGMGNRIAVALSAHAYAKATDRKLIIDWNDHTYFSPDIPDVFSALWEWPVADQTPLTDLAGLSVYPETWTGRLSDYRNDVSTAIMPYDLAWSRPPDEGTPEAAEMADAHDVVVITRDGDRDRVRDLYPSLLPRPFIRSRVGLLQGTYDWDRMIGVQIRHGNGERYLTPADSGWFHDKIGELRSSDPNLGLFLSTDSLAVVDEFSRTYETVLRAPQWFPAVGSGSMHHHPECANRFEHGVASLVDMWLLRGCGYLLLCRGGFGATVEKMSSVSVDRRLRYPGKIHASVAEKAGWDNPI